MYLDMDNPNAVKMQIEMIREIVRQEINKAPFNRMIPAKVVAVGSGVADVQLYGTSNTIVNVKNKSGVTLSIGDEIYLEYINNSTSNFYIAIKK